MKYLAPRPVLQARDWNIFRSTKPVQPPPVVHRGTPQRQQHRGRKENRPDENISRPVPVVYRKPVPQYIPTKTHNRSIFGSLQNLLFPQRKAASTYSSSSSTQQNLAPPPRKPVAFVPSPIISIKDFSLRYVLGAGAQGKVYLAKGPIKTLPHFYAIKVVDKRKMVGGTKMMLEEQRVLKQLKGHPFILGLQASFHDTRNFYLVTVCTMTGCHEPVPTFSLVFL